MADLLDEQRHLGQRISRVATNLKKRGKANLTVGMIRTAHASIEKLWSEYTQRDAQIRAALRGDAKLGSLPYFKDSEFEEVEEMYWEQAGVLLDLLAEYEPAHKNPESKNLNVTVGEDTAKRSRAVLPKINLPIFEGQYKDWPSFRDLFSSLIINDPSLSSVERLHYLKCSLRGEAANLLKNVKTTGDNFEVAWEKLKRRFANLRLLVQAQVRALTKIASVKRESSIELKRLFDDTFDVIDALENLERPVTNATDWIVELTVERLDRQSRREWEDSLNQSTVPPTLEQLKTFMEGRIHTCVALEAPASDEPVETKKSSFKAARVHQVSQGKSSAQCCSLCQGRHYILFCSLYKEKSPTGRRETALSLRLCVNCLGKHSLDNCKSTKRCQKCEAKHHSTLHDAYPESRESAATGAVVQHTSTHVSPPSTVLLGTARVRVSGFVGQTYQARSLIDPGSEVSLISEALAQRMGVQRSKARIPLLGVGGAQAKFTRGQTTLFISPHFGEGAPWELPVYIIPELSRYRPRNRPALVEWPHVQGLTLADPNYHLSDAVDILLGADSYNKIIREGVTRGPPNTPVAQETTLGWILTGGISAAAGDVAENSESRQVHHCNVDRELIELLTRFWEQEEVAVTLPETEDDQRAEEHFSSTHLRTPDGRFMVRLPFLTTPELGDSRRVAVRTLDSLTTRFKRSEAFRRAYREFMEAYEDLGHMAVAHPRNLAREGYYLPHHGVLRESSTTTKLRVVFNGSMASDNGKSLNDYLHKGPNLLPNLADILLRWRRYEFVFSADIEKMYRQILVHPEDRRWQRIVWRKKEEIEVYELGTVTYGLACAPFLAIRCLHQLAKSEAQQYPRGSQVVLRDIYMDDVLAGADTIQEARQIQTELRALLTAGGFPLRKWASNAKGLLEGLTAGEQKGIVEWDSPTLHSVLGIKWTPALDCFQVTAAMSAKASGSSKRAVLSGTAQIFDPLGWLSPVTIAAKILIQSLWILKVDWDSPLPKKEEHQWQQFQFQLSVLQNFCVPRWLGYGASTRSVEIHGFADASERAYAAVVYARLFSAEGSPTVSLIAAKSKVAPLKRVSLPRLELCAAFLLVKLIDHVTQVLEWREADLHLWTDSTVALSWIQGHPSRWPTYVANRVAEIQRLLPQARWHHVKSAENPADCASRGLSPAELPTFELWWQGPEWLSSSEPPPVSRFEEVPSQETESLEVNHAIQGLESTSCPIIERFSNLNRLLRVTAWCLRWLPGSARGEGDVLSAAEIQNAKVVLLRLEQAANFSEDIDCLRKGKPLTGKSRILKLSPFLDKDGVLRVGGRLQASTLAYDRVHPIILPNVSPLAKLWVDAAHKRCLHGGTQLTLATLRQECWILRGRPAVQSYIGRCTVCLRWKGQTAQPKMGNLPLSRLTPCRPFYRSGVDYAGPIQLRSGRGRGQQQSKGYIALFVCLTTKAVHLEVVSDGSTEKFLAALRRFVSRRGRCAEMYSDCGRNFVGANHELRTMLRESIQNGGGPFAAASREGIEWKFNPPSAPHFGGIWEAAVKSVKHHLRRVIGEQRLSYEELTTLLTGIEACLNSRPLQPLTDDPEDLAALTPGHFLIGGPLIAIPEPSLEDLPVSRLSRWQLIQQLQQHFWKRWSKEYLNTLQTRGKWCKDKKLIKVGTLCLVKNEILPPTQWPLARVINLHPGPDGSARVASIQTATSQFLRPVHKLIPLLELDTATKNE